MFDEFSRNDTSIRLRSQRWHGVVTTQTYPVLCKTWAGLLLLVAQGSRWLCEGQSFATCEEVSVPGSRMAAVLGGMYLGRRTNMLFFKKWRNMGTNLKRGNNTCCFWCLCKNWYCINICMCMYVYNIYVQPSEALAGSIAVGSLASNCRSW